ncbi:MAG TPA: terminase family protein, partial [Ktedonobacterales bacterium]
KRRLTWPNGAMATLYSAEDPDQLRGPNHDAAWLDELAAWKYLRETFDMLMFTLRHGSDPRAVITTTPRPLPLLRELLASPTTHVTRGRTYDNAANLAPAFLHTIITKYQGTRLGRQELDAEILEDSDGALWSREQLEALRIAPPVREAMGRIVVGVDPAATSGAHADETGIVVCGASEDGTRAFVLGDSSLRGSPHAWARAAVRAYHRWQADRIVAESNQGGEMVETTIHTIDPNVPVTLVHASRGKWVRAEPVAALFEQRRVYLVGTFPALEDQLVQWEPGESSPDRLDAMVWALTDLMLDPRHAVAVANQPIAVATSRSQSMSPWEQAREDAERTEAERQAALAQARESLAALLEESGGEDIDPQELAALVAEVAGAATGAKHGAATEPRRPENARGIPALDERDAEGGRMVASYASNGAVTAWETEAEAEHRREQEAAIARSLRALGDLTGGMGGGSGFGFGGW